MIADLNQTADLKLSILAPVKFRSQENFSSGRKNFKNFRTFFRTNCTDKISPKCNSYVKFLNM